MKALLVALFLTPFAAFAQQPGTISTMPYASVPFNGSELIYMVQGGVSKKTPVSTFFFGVFPTFGANQVLGALAATSPSGLPVPSCSATTSALDWTSGTGFGCQTLVSPAATQTLTNKTLTAPVLSGTVTGTYTLGGTPSITAPVLSGTVTGTYTLGGTPSIAGSAINSGTIGSSFVAAINLAAGGNGGVTGTLPLANGGTGATTQAGAAANVFPTPTRTGDVAYWNGSAWVTLAGNNSGTQYFSETSIGAPAWAAATGTGTVTSVGCGTGLSGGTITTTGTCALVAGVPAYILNTQIANYTVATSDCNKVIQAGTGSTGLFTVTLPAVFATTCVVDIVNGDTARGKILSGFPQPSNAILWPLQTIEVAIVNGAWVTTRNPGRWKNPSLQTIHVDKTNGNNANDGLAATTGAVADAQTAWNIAEYQFDTQGTTPIIAMACSQTHTVALAMGGTPLGSNLIQLSPDGNCSFTWTNSGPCISVNDLAELDLRLNQYGGSGGASFVCNTANLSFSGNIYLHNTVVLDLEGTPTWSPAGSNDSFLFCDGPCEFTIANGVTQATAAGGAYVIWMSEGGKGTQSGVISASAAGSLAAIYYLMGPAMLILGTSNGSGWASVGSTKVYGHATLISNGVTVAGGTSVGATGIICTSLSATC